VAEVQNYEEMIEKVLRGHPDPRVRVVVEKTGKGIRVIQKILGKRIQRERTLAHEAALVPSFVSVGDQPRDTS